MSTKLINELKMVQSAWTRGIANTIVHGRTDTDILTKSASDIKNMIIMQQGGLAKRPCTKLLRNVNVADIKFSASLQMPDGQNAILIQQSNGAAYIVFVDVDKMISVGTFSAITSYVQDMNIVLIAPAWKNITINYTAYTATVESFKFKSCPLKAEENNMDGYDIFITKGEPNSDSAKDRYFSIGDKVNVCYRKSDTTDDCGRLAFNGVFFGCGLYIKKIKGATPSDPANGVIIYGSTVGAQADTKANVKWRSIDPTKYYWGALTSADATVLFTDAFSGDNLPKYITQFQNRLWCAGINGDNKTIWASSIGDMHDFMQVTTDDDSPLSVVIAGSPNTPNITGLSSGITISAFTDMGVYAFINQTNTSITPTNFFIQRQNAHSCVSVTPVEYDQQLIYVQANNSNIRSLQYSVTALMTDNNLTILCPDIVNNPKQLAVVNSLDGDDNAYLFALNSDGSILCLQSVANQGIQGWSRWTFDFSVVAIFGTTNNRLLAIAKSGNTFSLVEFKNNLYQDHNKSIPQCLVVSAPFGMRDISIGDLLFTRKKVEKIKAYVYKTDGIIIEDKECSLTHFDSDYQDIKTGVCEVVPDTNFGTLNTVTIAHKNNTPFALLSLQVQIGLGG